MQFYSTNKKSGKASFKEATIKGLAPDKGLYFPERIPVFKPEFLKHFSDYSNAAIGLEMIKPYVGECIPEKILQTIVEETLSFEIPLVMLDEDIFSLELFHGPTLAFKDVGARFMSRCLGYFAREIKQKIYVLVATSGDTGSAVASGFYNVEGIEVIILYPSGKVSKVQEQQLTTLGGNVKAYEVRGAFDDCQRMVKDIFSDEEINKKMFLTSANSINVARWLPQQFYYGIALKNWPWKDSPPVISVPSGNFGNICAGMLAQRSGMPASKFIAGLNANDVVSKYLANGWYSPGKTIATISNAMDVGDPSNFVRMLELYNHSLADIKENLKGYSFSDEATRQSIKRAFNKYDYLTDPHGAVALAALELYKLENKDARGIFLETAHPVKFHNVVEEVIGNVVELPEAIQQIMTREKKTEVLDPSSEQLKELLMAK